MTVDTAVLPTDPSPLPRTGLKGLLRSLGARDEYGNPAPPYTGRVTINDQDSTDRQGYIYFRHGKVYAVSYTNFTPPLARRMFTAGFLHEDEHEELEKLSPQEIESYAVEKEYITADAAEDINRQMLLSSLTHMYEWRNTEWKWEEDVTTDLFTISPLEPNLVVAATEERQGQWDALARNYPEVTEKDTVPLPGPEWANMAGDNIAPELEAILTHVDGKNTVAHIAGACGLTRFELAGRLAKAVADEILTFAPTANTVTEDENENLLETYLAAQRELDDAQQRVEQAQQALDNIAATLESRGVALPTERT